MSSGLDRMRGFGGWDVLVLSAVVLIATTAHCARYKNKIIWTWREYRGIYNHEPTNQAVISMYFLIVRWQDTRGLLLSFLDLSLRDYSRTHFPDCNPAASFIVLFKLSLLISVHLWAATSIQQVDRYSNIKKVILQISRAITSMDSTDSSTRVPQ